MNTAIEAIEAVSSETTKASDLLVRALEAEGHSRDWRRVGAVYRQLLFGAAEERGVMIEEVAGGLSAGQHDDGGVFVI